MKHLTTFLFAFFVVVCAAAKPVKSPNGKITVNQTGTTLSVLYGKQQPVATLVPQGVCLDGSAEAVALTETGRKKIKEQYTMLTGKRSECSNEAVECTYELRDAKGGVQTLRLRVYNDGVAFRYELPRGGKATGEQTAYRLSADAKCWLQNYSTGYEDFFPEHKAADQGTWGYPALFQTADETFVLISEGGVERGRCASWIESKRKAGDFDVKWGSQQLDVAAGWSTPWRVMIIGSLADVVESTLITDVSLPSVLADASWVKPAPVSWVYWAYNHGSKDYQIVKQYIDMAAEIGLPYVLIDWEWEVMSNGGTMEDAVKYALSRGVKPLLWYNSWTSWINGAPGTDVLLHADTRKKEFERIAALGVAGVKIDFFDGDRREMMDYCIDILEDAARCKLLVNFHGATIPRGWQRTYPNFMSAEAVYGAEWYNNNGTLTHRAAAHNTTLPFTRNVVGPMDYTPCAFTDSQHPHVTTNAHELALTIAFESALQHLADRPESFLAQPDEVKDFLGHLPTAWDETRLLSGYPGKSVVIARRKGTTWYVAGLNGLDETQSLALPRFLKGKRSVKLFVDGQTERSFSIINSTLGTTIQCQPRGGFVAVIK